MVVFGKTTVWGALMASKWHPEAFTPTGEYDPQWGGLPQAISGLRDSSLGPFAKLVGTMLASRAQQCWTDDGDRVVWVAWPSLRQLSEDCGGISRQSIQRASVELRDAGLVQWTRGGWSEEHGQNRANTYVLDLLAMEALKRPAKKR